MDVKPTRSELIKLNKQIKLAKSGHSLLKKKRDGLILEFFEILKDAKNVRSELIKSFKDAQHKLNIARALHSDIKVKSVGLSVRDNPMIELENRNIMGVSVPKIKGSSVDKGSRKLGLFGSTHVIDGAVKGYEELLSRILKVAEVETAIKRLLTEIEKTKRRVNALEFTVIPKMQETKQFIKLRLEEMERENIFRLKKVKAKS